MAAAVAALGALTAFAAALPHFISPARARAQLSAAMWTLALLLRALVAFSLALLALAYVPHTAVFEDIAAHCWDAVVPLVTLQFELSGHQLADIAAILPILALLLSALAAVASVGRARWRLHRRLADRTVARGPLGSRIVDEEAVLIAVASIGRAEIVVSRGALEQLDRDELHASLCHERAHVERGHRPLLLIARVLRAIAGALPGTRSAERQLALSLERDADEHAVRATGDRLALASAICKAAGVRTWGAALPLSGDDAVLARLDALLEPARPKRPALVVTLVSGQGAVVAAVALLLAGWLVGSPAGDQAATHLAALCAI